MRIGELARRTDCDVETIRYYEKSGLMEEPRRNSAGYREYGPEHQERLQFIRHCRSLQMGLADIRLLLEQRSRPTAGCHRVNALIDRQIERIQAQMAALRTLEQQLTTLRHQCGEPHSIRECGILQHLAEPAGRQGCACHAVSNE